MLTAPDLSSVRVLSEREAGDRGAAALTVNDVTGECFLIIRELLRDRERAGAWCTGAGSEGVDRVIPGKPDPYMSLSAFAGGSFFAGGRVQSAATDVARVRLLWDDGYALEDEVQNGIALFLGAREALNSATAEFLDPRGQVITSQVMFVDEQ